MKDILNSHLAILTEKINNREIHKCVEYIFYLFRMVNIFFYYMNHKGKKQQHENTFRRIKIFLVDIF